MVFPARAWGCQGAPPTGACGIVAGLATLRLGPQTVRQGFSGGAAIHILFWGGRRALLATQAQLGIGGGLRFGDVNALRCRRRPKRGFLGILTVELLKVRLDLRIERLAQPYELSPADVPLLAVGGLKLAPVNRDQLSPKQVACFAQQRKLPTNLPDGGSIAPAEVGDGLEVRPPLAQSPHQCQIPGRFLFQAPTGPNSLQRAVQLESHQRPRIIARPPCCGRRRPRTASLLQIELLDNSIQKAHGVLCTDVIVDGFRQQVRLVAAPSATIAHAGASLGIGVGAHLGYPRAAG